MTAPLPALVGVGALAVGLQAFFGPKAQKMRKRNKQISSLRTSNRTIVVVTTAALPWMTGTSINPLLRAAYLSKLHKSKVILVVPWIPEEDQQLIFPDDRVFGTQQEQAAFIKQWIEARTSFACDFKVYFYPARYRQGWGSIFPTGDIPSVIPDDEADVVILEEPEHLNWFQHGTRWTSKFRHVVGIIHTNYLSYVRPQQNGFLNAVALYRITKWACRIHCHKVIKLSDAVQRIPRSITCNVHGVSPAFVEFGRERAAAPEPRFPKGAYFIGKVLWAKGYTELLDLLAAHQAAGHAPVPLDVVGKGEDLEAVQQLAAERQLPLTFLGARDHLHPSLQEYKVFINPSRSDVVATTTAEALAMGRWVVVEDLPCNEFFKQFPNTLLYKTPEQFSRQLLHALATEPMPLTEEVSRQLTWEAATERLLEEGSIQAGEWPSAGEEAYDSMLWRMYKSLAGLKVLKAAMGMTSATGEDVDPTEPTTPDLAKMAEEEDSDIDAALDDPALQLAPA